MTTTTQTVNIRTIEGGTKAVQSPLVGKLFAVTPDLNWGRGWVVTHLRTGKVALPWGCGIGLAAAKKLCRRYEEAKPKFTARVGPSSKGRNKREFLRVAADVAPKRMIQRVREELSASPLKGGR